MALDVPAVWDQIGGAVGSITGLRVFDYVPDQLSPPAAVVTLDTVEYDASMSRGFDRAIFKIWVAVGKVSERTARDALAAYANGAGSASTSIKAAVDALGPNVRVMRTSTQTLTSGGLEYLAAVFDVDYVA